MLMTKAAYARHKGVSRQTVYDQIARGELVLVGGKIDVNTTEQRRKGQQAGTYSEADLDRKVNISPRANAAGRNLTEDAPHQSFMATADEAAAMVLAFDDIYPPAATYEELQTRIADAAETLGLELRVIEAEGDEDHITGLEFYDPEQDCIACHFDSPLFELETLTFFRWLVVSKRIDSLPDATKAGLAALAEPFILDAKAIYEERAEE